MPRSRKDEMTEKDMITALYTEVVGINGRGGMRKDIQDVTEAGKAGRKVLHDQVDDIAEQIREVDKKVDSRVSKEECVLAQKKLHDSFINPPAQLRRAEVLKIRVLEVTVASGVIGGIYALVQLVKFLTKGG